MDVVDKGAFKKSIKESRGVWPILANHDPSNHIGYNMRAEEDEKGLYIEGKLNLDVQSAREKYSLAKQAMELGTNLGLSIGYMTIKAEPDRENMVIRHLKELKLFEYSLVTFPMNTAAMITSAKSLGGIDKANFILQELEKQGIKREELELALQKGAAPSNDPKKFLQSADELIKLMRS